MATDGGRTVSGRALVVGGLVVSLLVGGVAALLGTPLRERVLQETRPRTLREPIAEGDFWEAVARFDGEANCVELRVGDEPLDRACAPPGREITDGQVGEVRATRVPEGPVVAYGTASETLTAVNVVLEAGTTITVPVKAGELGFPVGFWATALPEGARLHEVVAKGS